MHYHNLLHLNQTPSVEYLGHPLNAYHFLYHLYWGRKYILTSALQNRSWFNKNIGHLIWSNGLKYLRKLWMYLCIFISKLVRKYFLFFVLYTILITTMYLLERLQNTDFELWPNVSDIEGAALAIARVWDQYKYVQIYVGVL